MNKNKHKKGETHPFLLIKNSVKQNKRVLKKMKLFF